MERHVIDDTKFGDIQSVTAELLKAGGILIGSKKLKVDVIDSDTDIAIHIDDIPRKFLLLPARAMSSYFSITPPLGNNRLLSITLLDSSSIDILIYEYKESVEVVEESIEVLMSVPKELLEIKQIRVLLFERLLLNREWVNT